MIGGHLGSRVSALVDGALSATEEDRAWQHLAHCADCSRLVERESWLKNRLLGLSDRAAANARSLEPPSELVGVLADPEAWLTPLEAHPGQPGQRGHHGQPSHPGRRRTTVVAVGAGSLGLAVAGLLVLTGGPVGRGEPSPPAPATIRSGVPSGGMPGPGGVLAQLLGGQVAPVSTPLTPRPVGPPAPRSGAE